MAEPKAAGAEPTGLRESIQETKSRSRSTDSPEEPESGRDHYRKFVELLSASKAPARHRERLGHCDPDTPWGAARKAIVDRLGAGAVIGIVGPTGRGKTQLGVTAIAYACWKGRSALYVESNPMLMQVRHAFKPDGPSEFDVYRRFCRPSLLVIDQMEERSGSDHESRMLFDIINGRYAANKDTLLIGNELPDAFMQQLGASIADRVRESGTVISCDWQSYRSARREA